MPTNVAGSKAGPKHHLHMVQYITGTVSFDSSGVAIGVSIGIIPKGAQIINALANVVTAFNAASTNVVVVGYGANLNEIFDAATSGSSITEGTPGGYQSAAALGLVFSADQEIKIKYSQTGTAATTGKVRVVISYVQEEKVYT